MSLIDYFPGTARNTQVIALKKIDDAIKKQKKFIILSAPTGSGKSHIGATIALSSKDAPAGFIDMVETREIYKKDDYARYIHEDKAMSYGNHRTMICTVTKNLQDQYNNLFATHSVAFKGKTNYMCNVDNNFDCEIAPCVSSPQLKDDCLKNKVCSYYNARDAALCNKFSILNYSSFLNTPSHTKQLEYLICDEASELEDEIIKHCTVEINYKQLYDALESLKIKPLRSEKPGDALVWLSDLTEDLKMEYDSMAHRLTTLSKKYNSNKRKLTEEMKRFKFIKNLYDSNQVLLKNWYRSEIVVEISKDKALFVPLYANNLSDLLFGSAKHVILMSATIIDPATFAKQLGIDDYEYIEIPSTFDSKKSPIFCKVAKYNINYTNIDKNLPKIITQIKKICNHYNKDKGIIHTHNFKITEKIQESFKGESRFLYRQPGSNNEKIVQEHKKGNSNSILVSPSLAFGTDLTDDQGRFQIIVKLPYLPLGSKRIKTLFDRDKVWYNNKMLTSLVQASGRCTRHKDDYSDTFILDGQVIQALKNNWHNLPQHFKDRIH